MTKKILLFLIIVMSVSLIGLILLQTYWIKNAIDVKEKNFSQLINKALTEINQKLETRETLKVISKGLSSALRHEKDVPSIDFLYLKNEQLKENFDINISMGEEVMMVHQGDSLNVNTKVTVFSGDSLIYKSHQTRNTPDITKTEIKDIYSKKEFQTHLKKNVEDKEAFVQDVVNKLMDSDTDLENRLDTAALDSIIGIELMLLGIDLDYEYGIWKSEKCVFCSHDYNFDADVDKYSGKLFANDLSAKINKLDLYFPKKDKYIFASLAFIGGSSIFLILIIILAFTITIYYIIRQKKLSEMKNDFVSNMTHELKTPISTISLASQMLRDTSIHSDVKTFTNITNIIDEESRRLSLQVEKVLQVAIFEKGTIKFRLEEINLNETTNQVLKNFIIQVEKSKGEIKAELHADNPIFFGDKLHITNVIFNLLDNAVKYSKEVPMIIISTRNVRKGVEISVEDSGIGIPKEHQKKIFEKFFRVPTGNLHNVKGFGLGLSYVRRIIEEHKGIIRVESEFNKGTKFEIVLPQTN